MSQIDKLTEERDVARARLKKARAALYKILKLNVPPAIIDDYEEWIVKLRVIAKSGCGTPKKRKKTALPGQIDLEEWINATKRE